MTLSYSKFMIDATEGLLPDIRCTVCGRSEVFPDNGIRLDEAVAWAESHQCAPLRVT